MFDMNNHCQVWLQNCPPYEVIIKKGDIVGILEATDTETIPLKDDSISAICEQIYQRLPKVKKKTWTRKEIEDRFHL
jgi:hypothetical protein